MDKHPDQLLWISYAALACIPPDVSRTYDDIAQSGFGCIFDRKIRWRKRQDISRFRTAAMLFIQCLHPFLVHENQTQTTSIFPVRDLKCLPHRLVRQGWGQDGRKSANDADFRHGFAWPVEVAGLVDVASGKTACGRLTWPVEVADGSKGRDALPAGTLITGRPLKTSEFSIM